MYDYDVSIIKLSTTSRDGVEGPQEWQRRFIFDTRATGWSMSRFSPCSVLTLKERDEEEIIDWVVNFRGETELRESGGWLINY